MLCHDLNVFFQKIFEKLQLIFFEMIPMFYQIEDKDEIFSVSINTKEITISVYMVTKFSRRALIRIY
ncbi:hypothetical protein HMPREF3138_12875 [Serratia sp. HMSC15F11]|nr:hypothetical protein HMPREF3138_12875 [Serratia sp. HMSC15F11]